MSSLPKTYNPAETEPRITEKWDGAKAFHADPARVASGEAEPYCILIPPPNVTAPLHLGHALNNTLQDVLVRAHRMMGFETLWMPGTDHAGIATQAVVERRLRAEGKLTGALKQSMKREEFVAQVQAFKDEYEATITRQLKDMGCSCDWERQRFTMDEQCAAAVYEAFFRLFKDGLIYRGKRLVNWDPVLQTAVADDECYDEEIDGSFYYLRYPLVHPTSPTRERGSAGAATRASSLAGASGSFQPVTWSELATRGYPGAEQLPAEQEAWVTVATTRPETYLGDTAVAVNPHDPRAKALRGLHVELPLVGRVIPVIEDSYVVLPAAMQEDPDEAAKDPKAAYATGFLKVTPAHDQNDWEIGQRHKLEAINVMAPDATISDKHGWSDPEELKGAHVFLGKKREEARKLAVKEFEARGLLEGVKPYRHSVKHSDRSKAIVEPYLSDQWYVKVTDERMAGAANRALVKEQRSPGGNAGGHGGSTTDNQLRFYPSRYAKTYEQWHDNIRDWCISRQLWWGHRIPVWKLEPAPGSDGLMAFVGVMGEVFDELGKIEKSGRACRVSWADMILGRNRTRVEHSADNGGRTVTTVHASAPAGGPVGEFVCVKDPDGADRDVIAFLESKGFVRDPDVLDTWFSSALWPMSTLGWPDPARFNAGLNEGMLEAFNPSSVLCTAREIITLWVSRMVMFNRYFLPGTPPPSSLRSDTSPAGGGGGGFGSGPVPFKDVFIHAMIQDGEGRKMSKSLGNGVDPRDIIESHGADAMRFTLVQMTTNTQDVRMPVQLDPRTGKNTSAKFDNGRNFCNKLWNTARFVGEKLGKVEGERGKARVGKAELSLLDKWMMSRLASTVKAVDSALAGYEFSDYAEAMYKVLWWDLCDWYLEGVKPTVEQSPVQRAVLAHALETILRLLHPITPFITEAIWERVREIETAAIEGVELGAARAAGLLCTAGWPRIEESWIDAGVEAEFERARELISAIRNVRSQHQVSPKRRVVLHAPDAVVRAMRSVPGLVETLGGVERVEVVAAGGNGSPPPNPRSHLGGETKTPFRALGEEMFLSNLADALDTGAERERLVKELESLRKSAVTMSARLENPGYVQRAPAKLVEESRAQLAKAKEEIAAIEAKLGVGGGA